MSGREFVRIKNKKKVPLSSKSEKIPNRLSSCQVESLLVYMCFQMIIYWKKKLKKKFEEKNFSTYKQSLLVYMCFQITIYWKKIPQKLDAKNGGRMTALVCMVRCI